MNGEKTQPVNKLIKLTNCQTKLNQLFFCLYGKIALWPNSYIAKMFAMKVLTAKMLVAKMLMVKLARTKWNISKYGANIERGKFLEKRDLENNSPREISHKEDNNHKRKWKKKNRGRLGIKKWQK